MKTGNNTNVQWNTAVLNAQGLQGRVVFGGEHHHHITAMNYLKRGRDYAVLEILKIPITNWVLSPQQLTFITMTYYSLKGLIILFSRGKFISLKPQINMIQFESDGMAYLQQVNALNQLMLVLPTKGKLD